MTGEIKPCPFCGGPGQIIVGQPGCWLVRCEGCSASTDDKGRERAIAAWNTRTPPPEIGKQILWMLVGCAVIAGFVMGLIWIGGR